MVECEPAGIGGATWWGAGQKGTPDNDRNLCILDDVFCLWVSSNNFEERRELLGRRGRVLDHIMGREVSMSRGLSFWVATGSAYIFLTSCVSGKDAY